MTAEEEEDADTDDDVDDDHATANVLDLNRHSKNSIIDFPFPFSPLINIH